MIQNTRHFLTAGVISFTSMVVSLNPTRAFAEEFSVVGFEKIVIVAPQLQLSVQPGNGNQVKVASQLGRSWSIREDGKTLRLTATTNPGATNLRAPFPKMEIVIPAVNLDVHLNEGSVALTKWTKPVLLDLQKGKITSKEMRANLSASLNQGQINISDHQGALNLDVYKGDIGVSDQTGALEVSGFQAQVTVEKLNGAFQFESNQGQLVLKDSSGALQFYTAKTNVQVDNFKGRIDGVAQDGNMSFAVIPETDIQLKSGTGRVLINSKTSGAMLALTSEQGEITAPKSLRTGKDKGAQVLRGRVKGKSGGRIEVFAQRGNIVVKE